MQTPMLADAAIISTVDVEDNRPTTTAKALGAYYTDAQIADFLVWWAVRSKTDTVLDPSFGGGVFLRSACERVAELGGDAGRQVFGAEIDKAVHRRIVDKLKDEFGVCERNLCQSDFFLLNEACLPQVDVVVGNPPFIRYQRFSGEARKAALAASARNGVKLSELASSWAPFVVQSIGKLRKNGRLAMVLPMEIAHADYARPVLEYMRKSFREVTFLTFRKKLFPDLSESTLLVLADGKAARLADFRLRDFQHAGALHEVRIAGRVDIGDTKDLDAAAVASGRDRFTEYFMPRRARELYRELGGSGDVWRLSDLADVGIGYVSGANDFFHLAPSELEKWDIPKRFVKRAVRRTRGLRGLRFTRDDWQDGLGSGDCAFLLHIDKDECEIPPGVRSYVALGQKQGVSKGFKCRTRSPWFSVPHVYRPDAFLSYMSGRRPVLVANDAGAVAPNTLHIVRLHRASGPMTPSAVAALWQTSLVRLSVEIEGHALGGGMLKLEPAEAESVIIPRADPESARCEELADELDALARCSGPDAVEARADEAILVRGLGLSRADCKLLRSAAEMLFHRRYSRTDQPQSHSSS